MSVELCPCPVLRAAAVVEQLAGMGMEVGGYDPVRHHIIAALRQQHGCRGPGRHGDCPWNAFGMAQLQPGYAPEVRPSRDGGYRNGQYL